MRCACIFRAWGIGLWWFSGSKGGRLVVACLLAMLAVVGAWWVTCGRDPKDVELYAAFLNEAAENRIDPNTAVVVHARTSTLANELMQWASVEAELTKRIPQASPAAVRALSQVGSGDTPLADELTSLVRKDFLSGVLDTLAYNDIFSSDSLEESYKCFAHAILVRFSRIGFDAQTKQALFVVSSHCGGLCGTGRLVLMQRNWCKWRVVAAKTIWVA